MPEDDVRGTEQARVIVFDTTLRDGEQSPGATLTADEKLEVADALVELGVDVMEAGFPAASPGDFEAVRAIANRVKGVTVAGLARCNESDIERAAMAVKGAESARIHTFIATSDIHLKHKLRMSRAEVLERVDRMVRFAKAFTSDVEFSAEDATRSDWEFLAQVFGTAIAAGATTINVPDTVGYTSPLEYAALMEYLTATVPGVERGHHLRSLPRRPRYGHGEHAGGGAGRGAAGRSDHEWHRRARRQHLARRSRHGAGDARRPVRRRHDTHSQGAPGSGQPARQHLDRRSGSAEQGHRRRERVCPRGRHPPGRDAEGAHDVRDHGSDRRRLGGDPPRARQALRAGPGSAIPCRRSASDWTRTSSTRRTSDSWRWPTARRPSPPRTWWRS